MEETLASPKMEEIDLINSLERISYEIPNSFLGVEFYITFLKKITKNSYK